MPGGCPRFRGPVVARRYVSLRHRASWSVRVTRPTVPTILSPCKDHSQGRSSGRVCDGAQTAPPLTLIFHGKPIGTYQVGRGRARQAYSAIALMLEMPYSTSCASGWTGGQSGVGSTGRRACAPEHSRHGGDYLARQPSLRHRYWAQFAILCVIFTAGFSLRRHPRTRRSAVRGPDKG
jgi:hypothetical protein